LGEACEVAVLVLDGGTVAAVVAASALVVEVEFAGPDEAPDPPLPPPHPTMPAAATSTMTGAHREIT
jgi:hypothetical protein